MNKKLIAIAVLLILTPCSCWAWMSATRVIGANVPGVAAIQNPCYADGATPGTVCNDGSVYAGTTPDGSVRMFTTRCDYGMSWSGSACTGSRGSRLWDTQGVGYIGVTSYVTGSANTAAIIAAAGGNASKMEAAYYCSNLTENSKSDWYLPAVNELIVLYTNRTAIGNFLTSSGAYYYSSTETDKDAEDADYACFYAFDSGTTYCTAGKSWNALYVRCVRKD